MILKNILGKTIDAAKKTAQQMYGDDFLVIESVEAEGGQEAKITIFSDGKKKKKNSPQENKPKAKAPEANKRPKPKAPGVRFERSTPTGQNGLNGQQNGHQKQNGTANGKEEKLNSLRNYALQLENKDFGQHFEEVQKGTSFSGNGKLPSTNGNGVSEEKPKNTGTTYSRSSIRSAKRNSLTKDIIENDEKAKAEEKTVEPSPKKKEKTSFKAKKNGEGSTGFNPTKKQESQIQQAATVIPTRNEEREINALHKRFDKLEALLDSSLISANLDYASHPAFQQLVQTGINTSVIARWFSQIIEKGIDPYEQSEQFMAKLAGIIREALGKPVTAEPQKYMLFVGPSGSGKTSLIMKLCQHPLLLDDKKIAVVSVYPQTNKTPYYTILKPFCEDNEIPHFDVKKTQDVNKMLEEFEEYDHVLIDTPSINIEQNHSFRDFWKIRQMLTPLTPLEVHYVVNASLNRYYFRNSSATHHPLHPDYIAITHLDEVSQWGPIIPFLQEMGSNARYISKGNTIPNSLDEFNPQWFAQKILEEN